MPGSCPGDYHCETCGCDYRRLDAVTWYCPFCDAKMVEVAEQVVNRQDTQKRAAEAGDA
jgi:uncharacterized Zn finger protein (UPF0148 family)